MEDSVILQEQMAIHVPSVRSFGKIVPTEQFIRWYACELGMSMWDTNIFALIFCYQLKCRCKNIEDLQSNMKHEVEVLSLGWLRMQAFPEQQRAIELFPVSVSSFSQFRVVDAPVLDSMIQEVPLMAFHAQRLIDHELKELEDYKKVRELVRQIFECFSKNQSPFKDLDQQIQFLASSTLQEALGVIQSQELGEDTDPSNSPNSPTSPLSFDPSPLLNIPNDVIQVISVALAKQVQTCKDKRQEFPVESFLDLLQKLAGHFTKDSFERSDESRIDGNPLLLCSSNAGPITDSETKELLENIESECQATGINIEDLKLKMYFGHSSFWLVLISQQLDAERSERLKQVVSQFVEQKRTGSSLAWIFATPPRVVPSFAAPGLVRVISLMERLRNSLDIPKIMCLRAKDLTLVAQQLLKQNGKDVLQDQVRVVVNYKDLHDDAWLDAQNTKDLHFVVHDNWRNFSWKDENLLKNLQELAKGHASQTNMVDAVAYLAYELENEPSKHGILKSLNSMLKKLQPKELLKVLLESWMADVTAEPAESTSGFSTASGHSTPSGYSTPTTPSGTTEHVGGGGRGLGVVGLKFCNGNEPW